MIWTDKELKMLRIALDPSAHQGEAISALHMLQRSLIKRGLNMETIGNPATGQSGNSSPNSCDHVMPVGQWTGVQLKRLSTEYLTALIVGGAPLPPETRNHIIRHLHERQQQGSPGNPFVNQTTSAQAQHTKYQAAQAAAQAAAFNGNQRWR